MVLHIYVKTLSGKTLTLVASGTDTIRDLKMQIQEKEGVISHRQSLISCGKQLDDQHTLLHYGLQNESTIQLVLLPDVRPPLVPKKVAEDGEVPSPPPAPRFGSASADSQTAGRQFRAEKSWFQFTIDCRIPVADGVLDIVALERFLQQRIKVDGKAGALAGSISVTADKDSILVTPDKEDRISKRYLKYLTRKFLQRQEMRDWIRVAALDKTTYQLRYFSAEIRKMVEN